MRRAQTSIEYLSTYAWAFLALVVTVAALSLFGVFDTDTYIPEECESGSQISCQDSFLVVSGTSAQLVLRLQNNFPRNIEVLEVELGDEQMIGVGTPVYGIVYPGSTVDVAITNSSTLLRSASKYTIPFTITFKRAEGTGNYTVTGRTTLKALGNDMSVGYCGDGVVQGGEECDWPGPPGSGMPHPDNQIRYGCTSDCRWMGYCGDRIWQRGPMYTPEESCGEPPSTPVCALPFICNNCICYLDLIPCETDPDDPDGGCV